MTTQVNTKIRLVRCPKCREVLAELPDVPLYKCGGCGTILQAKNGKMETNPKEATIPNPPEASSLNNDSRMELCDNGSVSNVLSVSPKVTCSESEDSPLQVETRLEESGSPLNRFVSPKVTCSESEDSPLQVETTFVQEERGSPLNCSVSPKVTCSGSEDSPIQVETSFVHEESGSPLNRNSRRKDSNNNDQERALSRGESFQDKAPHSLELKDEDNLSHENSIALQSSDPSIEVDDNDIDNPRTFTTPNTEEKSASLSALKASLISGDLVSSDIGHLDHSIRKVTQHQGSNSSVDTEGSSPLADPMPELIATRSYYGYDGSESSYDGTDDQITDHISHPSRRKYKEVDHRTADGYRCEPEMNYGAQSSSFIPYRATKGGQRNQDQFTGTERHSHIIGHRMRLEKEGVSRLPFDLRDFPFDHRTGNPSVYSENLLPPRPGFDLPHKHLYSVPDKTDLLRTVCELKDQLDRIQFPKLAPNVRFAAGGGMERKHTPYHFDHLTPEREMYADYHVRYNQPIGARMAFSGEAAHYQHQMNCSCLHCCPQNRYFSAQLPSYSSSPQHYTSSELSWGRQTNFDNQRHRENEIKRSYHLTKKHLQPIAGGAPFLACYHCSVLLQIPADFLLFKKRYHKLLCNACKKVLKFSLLQRSHIVPYLSDAPAPPPSEVEDFTNAINRRNRVQQSSEMSAYNRNISSGSSYEHMENRKMKSVMKESATFESVGPSKTWEIEEQPTPTSSTLHRLMGYSSPSQVFKR